MSAEQEREEQQDLQGRLRSRTPSLEMIAIDLDGTLVDSVKDLHQAVVHMQSGLSMPPSSEADVLGWIGNGIERLVHRVLTGDMHADAEPTQFASALSRFRQAYTELIGRYSCLYPGVLPGLDWMAAQNIPLVVVTNKDSVFANELLLQLGIRHYFAHLIGGDDVRSKKPDPEGLLLAAQLCSASPQQCLLLGDSISDFRAAAAAGFSCVGLSYGYNHGQALDRLPAWEAPDAIVDSFEELPGLLG